MRYPPIGEIPLVCRATEMERILAQLNGPEPVAFVLAGAAGVGKTRLASEAARSAAGLGFATAVAMGSRALASIPFGPFAPLLPGARETPRDLLGLLRQASEAIAGRAGPQRKLLLVVDDAQHLDDGSAALVHQLVQAEMCSVLASVRTPGPAPDLVTALWKDGLAERIEVSAWNEAQTGQVLAAALGGPVALATVRRLWQLSQGNALYLHELLLGAVGTDSLTQAGGIWSLHKPLTAPARLVELVASRLGTLAPGTVAVIQLLAASEPLGLPVLDQITEPGCLEDAEARGSCMSARTAAGCRRSWRIRSMARCCARACRLRASGGYRRCWPGPSRAPAPAGGRTCCEPPRDGLGCSRARTDLHGQRPSIGPARRLTPALRHSVGYGSWSPRFGLVAEEQYAGGGRCAAGKPQRDRSRGLAKQPLPGTEH